MFLNCYYVKYREKIKNSAGTSNLKPFVTELRSSNSPFRSARRKASSTNYDFAQLGYKLRLDLD